MAEAIRAEQALRQLLRVAIRLERDTPPSRTSGAGEGRAVIPSLLTTGTATDPVEAMLTTPAVQAADPRVQRWLRRLLTADRRATSATKQTRSDLRNADAAGANSGAGK